MIRVEQASRPHCHTNPFKGVIHTDPFKGVILFAFITSCGSGQDQQGDVGGAGGDEDEEDDFFGTGEGGGLGAAFDKAFNTSTKRAVPLPDPEVRKTSIQARAAGFICKHL